jgi:hypothetical protein
LKEDAGESWTGRSTCSLNFHTPPFSAMMNIDCDLQVLQITHKQWTTALGGTPAPLLTKVMSGWRVEEFCKTGSRPAPAPLFRMSVHEKFEILPTKLRENDETDRDFTESEWKREPAIIHIINAGSLAGSKRCAS